MSNFKVALLIPTLNAGKEWIDTLNSIESQVFNLERKIIIDSGSSDDTSPLAKSFGFEVVEVNKLEFNHGKTRQQLVELSGDVDICVFLTQDAILASPKSISNIVNVFNDPEIGMAYGRQLPHENAKVLEIHARLYNYPAESNTRSYSDRDLMGFKVFFCSNSFAAYRRSALSAVGGFPSDSIMGEDAIVAAKMLSTGFKKAYVAEATVYHSHSYTVKEEFKRYFDTRVFHEQNSWLIDSYGKPTGEGLKFMKSELRYVFKNSKMLIFKSIASLGAKWLGYKTGSFYHKMPLSIIKKLSMHRHYWR
ncbi:MAG: glycosyltransferase [Bacteroidota bacterium]|nr:glycosyltransferase [Bacteroidota bacterium]